MGKIIDLGSSFIDIFDLLDNIEKVDTYLKSENLLILDINSLELLPPLKPRSLRDAYAFRQHVETSRKNRGLEMIKEFDDFPVYYYSNADAVMGPGNINIDKNKYTKVLWMYKNNSKSMSYRKLANEFDLNYNVVRSICNYERN